MSKLAFVARYAQNDSEAIYRIGRPAWAADIVMTSADHTLQNLFEQLGLQSSPQAIDEFIARHRVSAYRDLAEASFWTPAQAEFIRECWQEDSDWAGVVDQLDARLRA